MTNTNTKNKYPIINIKECRGQLLKWYDKHRRALPWRALPGEVPDPYHVWLSEIMLQQTTVGAVKSYYERFLKKWPTVHDLAAAELEEVTNEWAGLGYYNRARNLHKCAHEISINNNGLFPNSQVKLKELPGIGDYTSAAISTIAFNQPATVVDGNIERIISRLFSLLTPLPKVKNEIKTIAHNFFPSDEKRPGDLAQALMDLGATICIAKTPRCALCPISEHCTARKEGIESTLPRREKKKKKPQRYGEVYWIVDKNKRILLHRRPDKGLLANMLGLPTSEWTLEKTNKSLLNINNIELITEKPTHISHIFTHFNLRLELKTATIDHTPDGYFWKEISAITPSDFPTAFKKPLKIFLKAYVEE